MLCCGGWRGLVLNIVGLVVCVVGWLCLVWVGRGLWWFVVLFGLVWLCGGWVWLVAVGVIWLGVGVFCVVLCGLVVLCRVLFGCVWFRCGWVWWCLVVC